jgi:type IV pilus assembly protein PilA
MKNLKLQKGFTLIELLVVIGILAVLLAITLIAINPARQFAQANNTKRRSDVNAILNAVDQFAADNKGILPAGITTSALTLKKPVGTDGVDICEALVPTYIAALPSDPQVSDGVAVSNCAVAAYDTGYTIVQSADNNRVTVTATTVELEDPVSVTR